MDKKEELKNNIMLKMQYHIDSQTLDLLGVILTNELIKVDVAAPETSVATQDNTNEYIIQLFMMKKAPKLSRRTVDQYLGAVRSFLQCCPKPLTKVTTMDVEKWLSSISFSNSNKSLNNNNQSWRSRAVECERY